MLESRSISILSLLFFAMAATAAAEPLTLGQCLQLARDKHPALQAVALTPAMAQDEERRVAGALWPQVEFSAGYTVQNEAQQVVIGSMQEPTQDSAYASGGLRATQTLYDFGRRGSRVEQTAAQREAAQQTYVAREQEAFLQLVTAYYQVLKAQSLLQAAQDETTRLEEHLRIARTLFEQGVVTRNDVLQAEVGLAGSRQMQLARQGMLTNAWAQLNYFTGRPDEARGELEPAQVSALPAEGVCPEFFSARPDLAAQRSRLESSRQAVAVSRTGHLPELFARVGVDYLENSHVTEQAIWSATLGFKVNLFDGGASSAALRQALKAREQERATLRAKEQEASLEYRMAQTDADTAHSRIGVTEEAIRQAQENLRINRDRYAEQVGTATEVTDAQTLLARTETDYHQSLFDYQVALARLAKASGRLAAGGENHD